MSVASSYCLRAVLTGIAISLSLVVTPSVVAAPVTTVIAEETFAYAANALLPGNNGGTGWSGPWESDSVSFTDFVVGGTSLSVPGLTSSGGSAVFVFNGTNLNDARRDLALQNSGVVFLQFASQFGTQSGGGTPSIRLVNTATGLTGGIGNNGSCGAPVYAILDTTLQAPLASACSAVSLSTLAAVVVRIDYTTSNTKMWVLPSLVGFDYLTPPAPSAEYPGLAPVFDRIALYSRDPAAIDELRVFRVAAAAVGVQPVPLGTPAGLAITALVLAAFAARRLRRQK